MNLSQIKQPDDIRNLSVSECNELAEEIRTKIIRTVARNGGHLASNLGAVEITLALHRTFHTPEDKFVFDVGHQAYTHKLLTGRYDRFDTLRTYGGLSGFPKCAESVHDCFETGHASTAISAALGLARARDFRGEKHHVIAVVGDGALTGGMCYEALNDCGNSKTKLILVLNDNEMSIARNVGALSKHLSQLRASASWNSTKKRVKLGLSKIPVVGKPIHNVIHSVKKMVKSLFMNEVNEGFFTALGFKYIGPIDGHDVESMQNIFEQAKRLDEPVVIHCATKKGYGYRNAEESPEQFHGTTPFFIESGEVRKRSQKAYGSVAVGELIELAKQDDRIVAVTAAMPLGTGVSEFEEEFPERCIDVGIAEEHAVTMCAGLARGGMRPIFFVYSTFLQRGYDQVVHDVCLQKLPVLLMLDRSGLPNEDGQSHQGLFDFAYLRHIPNMTVLSPADADELKEMVHAALALNAPCSIRYPKNAVQPNPSYPTTPFAIGRWRTLLKGGDGTILATGSMVGTALHAAQRLRDENVNVEVVNASSIVPLDAACIERVCAKKRPIVTIEEHVTACGFGSAVLELLSAHGLAAETHLLGVDNKFVTHGDHESLLKDVGLDDETVLKKARSIFSRKGEA